MKLGILVNVMDGGKTGSTNYRIAAAALEKGHEVWITSPSNFAYNEDGTTSAFARTLPCRRYEPQKFVDQLNSKKAINKWITLDDLDVLLLRSNPAVQVPWAEAAGIHFGRLAMRKGVIVLNDPNGLGKAMNKLYLQTFPEEVRPRTLVTRHHDRVAEFLTAEGTIIVKPLQGSGGSGVFIARAEDMSNLAPIIHAVSRDGYVIAQEYLPEAADGDTRLFLMNGVPLQHDGKYAAFRRIRAGDDLRSNIHAGGKLRRAEVDDDMLRIAELVRPRLVEDGMFLVGLDIVGNKLIEINVFSPGGLGSAQKLTGVDFTGAILEALQRKVDHLASDGKSVTNVELATL